MPTQTFRIIGTVTDTQTRKPVPDVRVEAWNNPTPQHVVLGSGTTDAQGRFQIVAEAEVPAAPVGGATGVVPATLKVFQGTQALAATGDTSIPNLFDFGRSAVLQVQVAQVAQPLKDHVTVDQVLTTLNFVHQSDFAGVFREGRDRTTAIGAALMNSVKAAVKSISIKPLHPPSVRNRDVINQDPGTARRRLEEQKVTVTSVQPYQPGIGTLGNLASIGSTINPGDKVDLFEENGVVKAYKITRTGSSTGNLLGFGPPKSGAAAPADMTHFTNDISSLQADVRTLQARTQEIDRVKAGQESNAATLAALQQKAAAVDQLQAQLAKVQAESVQKDQAITTLQNDLAAVRAAHNAMASKVTPDRLAALEETVRKLQGPR